VRRGGAKLGLNENISWNKNDAKYLYYSHSSTMASAPRRL